MKYIIMECHSSYVVLLDENGCFFKAANLHYQVGQTVEKPVLMKEPETKSRWKMRVVTGLAAAAACLVLVFTGYYRDYVVKDAFIYLTINPSVCMELNRRGQVVSVTGVNEDGQKLLEGYHRESKDRMTVTKELIGRAVEMGYLSAGGKIVLDIDAPDEAVFQKYGIELRTGLTEYLADSLVVEIQIIKYGGSIEEGPEQTEEKNPIFPPAEIEIEKEDKKQPEVSTEEKTEPESVQEPEQTAPAVNETTIKTDETSPEQQSSSQPSVNSSDHNREHPVQEKNSDDNENSDYGQDKDVVEGSDYGEDSDYNKDTEDTSSSGYDEGSDYANGSDYDEGSDDTNDSDYGERSDDTESSDYDNPSDYE